MGSVPKMKLAILLCALVVCALAATPSKPRWPTRFSASVLHTDSRTHEGPRFVRWFYDSKHDVDRWDGPMVSAGEVFFVEQIFDHKAEIEWFVGYQPGLMECFERPLNKNESLPHPVFANYEYRGISIIDYEECYSWHEETEHWSVDYFEVASDRSPKLFTVHRHHTLRSDKYEFHEFDLGKEDPNLYQLPKWIKDTCNKVSE